MDEDARSYIKRSKSVLESSSKIGERDVERIFVEPLITLLGWDDILDVRTQFPVKIGTTTYHADYTLSIDDEPQVLIEAKSNTKNLNSNHGEQLTSYMRQIGVDWGLLTNGERYQIFLLQSGMRSSDAAILSEVDVNELESELETIKILSKSRIQSGESYDQAEKLNTKKQAIEDIQNNRDNITSYISNYLVEQSDDSLSHEINEHVDSFVDDLIQNLSRDATEDEIPKSAVEIIDIVGTGLPGQSEKVRQDRAAIILTAYKHLQKDEVAKLKDIEQYLSQKHPNTFLDDDGEFERHWVNYIRDNLAELPRVEQPAGGYSPIWRYVPPELDEEIEVDEIEDWIIDLENIPSGIGESVYRQQAMIQQSYLYLKEVKNATKDDFETILPRYTAHYQDFDGFWSYCLRKALNKANDVEAPVAGHREWRYIGNETTPDELDLRIDDWIVEIEIPGHDYTLKQRRALLQFAYNHLKQLGKAQRGDFEKIFKEKIPSQTGRYNTFDGLWSYVLKDKLKMAPDVDVSGEGRGKTTTYKYRP
jgi:hypothetical protein